MWVVMAEATVAFFLLVFIVWWTMYAGKKPVPPRAKTPAPDAPPAGRANPAQRAD